MWWDEQDVEFVDENGEVWFVLDWFCGYVGNFVLFIVLFQVFIVLESVLFGILVGML